MRLLIFYSGFATFLVGVLASKVDHNQKVLSPEIIQVPFINWILMISFGLMMVCANAFFMKSIKSSTPTIGVCLTQMVYVIVLLSIDCILLQKVLLSHRKKSLEEESEIFFK